MNLICKFLLMLSFYVTALGCAVDTRSIQRPEANTKASLQDCLLSQSLLVFYIPFCHFGWFRVSTVIPYVSVKKERRGSDCKMLLLNRKIKFSWKHVYCNGMMKMTFTSPLSTILWSFHFTWISVFCHFKLPSHCKVEYCIFTATSLFEKVCRYNWWLHVAS